MIGNDQAEPQLTPKQDQLIELLLAGVNIAAAARQLKIGDKTARRWLRLAHFREAYKLAQQSLFDEALQGLQRKVNKAIDTLDRNMNGDEVPASVQVRSAQIVLEQAISIGKMGELERKIAELEQYIKNRR